MQHVGGAGRLAQAREGRCETARFEAQHPGKIIARAQRDDAQRPWRANHRGQQIVHGAVAADGQHRHPRRQSANLGQRFCCRIRAQQVKGQITRPQFTFQPGPLAPRQTAPGLGVEDNSQSGERQR